MPFILFSPQQLDEVVKKTLVDVPSDHRIAMVATVDMRGIPIAVQFTSTDGHWKIRGAFEHDWNGDNSVGASVMFSK